MSSKKTFLCPQICIFLLKSSISLWLKKVPCGYCEDAGLQPGHMLHTPLSLHGHQGSTTATASLAFEWKQKNEGREGWTHDSVAELLPSTSAMGFLPRTVKLTGGRRVEPGRRNPIFIAVCTVRQRQVNAAPRAAPCPVQTDDVAHQLSRAGTCSLIRAGSTLQRHLFPRYHSTLQKEQKKGLANHSHSLWGSSVLRTNCVM